MKTKENTLKILLETGVPLWRWGRGAAKEIGDLMEEVEQGDSIVTEEKGKALRKVAVACVDVYYRKGEKELRLREDRQEFKDGRVRRRELLSSLSEKIKQRENPKIAAYRGITEELGVRGQIGLMTKEVINTKIESPSYPGLMTSFRYHFFDAYLDQEQFREEGYVEIQPRKKIYFVWEEEK
ncbi:hypothetical protein A2574_04095 [Candidatus Shapirobacteria bacterium RIFOXYD1_FULL_38_32]|uniref:Nudix hydrolase domain-containing protein n=2 Tax=Candidatus Shapironibacteriota TaxID=1752721 RepID=A0A0G0JUQ9_9BACT|nr:MAG: hypothetical protein US90_C0007G0025 [Candidatus Shapirobacteria bacterium GW2011_GWE2_38_30]OGL55816.1 MAG: hypothetical protein A2195_02465 [Candidatus Shapirobacteria bacterium RIFOXYA1_FULL_39_17]OGL56706.1 MAG: hypothetical protein A2367_03480 [Candidatus Shapirobacteria bacterium RIFOXYB1_FULL_38_38]OGL57046.1 MAG: hypothetical protein A2410_02795 [Candidatus Shapirobacteria bacterium RIFOXYC1_FULL_38_24]OGL58298.1 MAG: hypothetical protein A2574_04095 [Candidatus Shapirobacteria 